MQGVILATLNMRIPDLQLRAGLNDAELGLVLIGGPIGALASFPLAARLMESMGTRRMILLSYCVMALAAAGMASSTHGYSMFVLLAVVGAMSSFSNIAINVEADRVEGATAARLMNRCHGGWSVAFLVASTVAGLIRGAGIDPTLHLYALAPVYILATLILVLPMIECPPRASDAGPRRWLIRPTVAVLSLVAFGLGADLLEGASRVWATIYLRDVFEVTALIESMAVPALVLTMAGGRLVADRPIDRYGPVRVARWSLTVAVLGVALVVAAGNAWLAITGFALAGLGVGVVYPLMISGAARLGDRPAAENVAATTMIFQIIMLFAPMLIGGVAEALGIRIAFALLLPLLALGWLMAASLR
jgi:MFS family permease